jgi:hypothetical protein
MIIERLKFRKILFSVSSTIHLINLYQDRFVKDIQVNEWITTVVSGMKYFSNSQKRRFKDMIDLEFFGKGTELIQEGVINTKAYMIIKGEVELKSAHNLYTISV